MMYPRFLLSFATIMILGGGGALSLFPTSDLVDAACLMLLSGLIVMGVTILCCTLLQRPPCSSVTGFARQNALDTLTISALPSIIMNAELEIVQSNHAFNALLGTPNLKPALKKFADILDESAMPILELLKKQCHSADAPIASPYELILKTGGAPEISRTVLVYISQKAMVAGQPLLLLQLMDISEQKALELRYSHSQKMQAVGQLAGGIAHDFNNLLTAMMGFCDLLLIRHPVGDPSFFNIMQIKQTTNRAANLVRQLLAFSRKQTLQAEVLDISDVIADVSHLIRRLIGSNIALQLQHGQDLKKIFADQGQLEQVLMNLAVNARDAMQQTEGILTIRTRNITMTQETMPKAAWVSPPGEESIPVGDYILLEVSDTGHGMSPEIMNRIFEPFFSTKEVGAGTGLGLSTVYGIIKQTGGYMYVRSEAGRGTSFSIYLKPFLGKILNEAAAHTSSSMHETPSDAAILRDLTGSATILIVEDEDPVRIFASTALSNKGYTVLEARSAQEALAILDK